MTKGRSPKEFPWPEWTDRLIELINEKRSFGNIAAALTKESGRRVTRSGVAGRTLRLGLKPPNCASDGRGKVTALKKKRAPKTPVLSSDQKEYILGAPITPPGACGGIALINLERDHCRWPVNELARGGEYLFCGAPKIEGYSYCELHAAIACVGSRRTA